MIAFLLFNLQIKSASSEPEGKCTYVGQMRKCLYTSNKRAERSLKTRPLASLKFTQPKLIPAFEIANDITVNVYGFQNTLYLSPDPRPRFRYVHLLFYNDHYSLVRNLARLMSSQTRHNGRKYYCDRCLVPQHSAEHLRDHQTGARQTIHKK